MKKLYIGCSLTYAPQEFKSEISNFKDELRQEFEVLDFVGLTVGTPRDVYEWDVRCVKECDLFVADCSYPAIGLGFEIGIAHELKKPTLLIAHEDQLVTRIIKGIYQDNFEYHTYKKISEILPTIKAKLA